MESINKKEILTAVIVLLIGGLFFYFSKINISQTPSQNGLASLVLDFSSDKKRAFEGPVIKDMTMLQSLLASSKGGNFDIKYAINSDGTVDLASINDETEKKDGKKWHFYLNGKPVLSRDLNLTQVKAGDEVEAVFE